MSSVVRISPKYGCWNVISDQLITRTLSNQLDFLLIDLEHGFRDFKDFVSAFSAAQNSNCEIYVRVRKYNDPLIQSLLDLGVTHFIVPQIRDLVQLNEFIQSCTFPPNGRRGLHPRVYQSSLKGKRNLEDVLAEKIQICVIIETKESLEFVEEICSNPLVSEIYLGVYDLSMALGLINETESQKMLDICLEVSQVAKRFAKPVMAMLGTTEILNKFALVGVSKIVIGIDSSILQNSVDLKVESFQKEADSSLE